MDMLGGLPSFLPFEGLDPQEFKYWWTKTKNRPYAQQTGGDVDSDEKTDGGNNDGDDWSESDGDNNDGDNNHDSNGEKRPRLLQKKLPVNEKARIMEIQGLLSMLKGRAGTIAHDQWQCLELIRKSERRRKREIDDYVLEILKIISATI
jgi:hypothetical protein